MGQIRDGRRCGTAVVGGAAMLAAMWLLAGVGSAHAGPSGPQLSGTYDVVASYGTATAHEVMHVASSCAQCDATATSGSGGTVALTWTGAGWQGTTGGGCGPMTSIITPVGTADGVVQTFTTVATFLTPETCGIPGPGAGTGTRIGN